MMQLQKDVRRFPFIPPPGDNPSYQCDDAHPFFYFLSFMVYFFHLSSHKHSPSYFKLCTNVAHRLLYIPLGGDILFLLATHF